MWPIQRPPSQVSAREGDLAARRRGRRRTSSRPCRRRSDRCALVGALGLRVGERRHRRHRRPRADRVDRPLDHLLRRATRRRTTSRRRCGPARPASRRSRSSVAQVRLHQRLQRGVDRGRGRAPVLADDRVQPVRERVRDPRPFAPRAARATRSSCAGLTIDQSRQTATASAPEALRVSAIAASDARLVERDEDAALGVDALRGSRTSGSAGRTAADTGSGGTARACRPRAASRTSGNPSVVKNAVRAVLPSTIAFVARVVPYVKTSVCASSSGTVRPSSGASCCEPLARCSRTRARTSVSALARCSTPASSATTTSVNVPPVSTEIR